MFISQTISNHKYQSVSLTGEINAKNNKDYYYNRFHCSSSLKRYVSDSRLMNDRYKTLSTLGECHISYSRSGDGEAKDSQIFLIL